jgi:hypothetical protein
MCFCREQFRDDNVNTIPLKGSGKNPNQSECVCLGSLVAQGREYLPSKEPGCN